MASSANHFGVNLKGIYFEDFLLTVALAAGITSADIGKAVTKDGTVANGYKLAGDGDRIDGRLESVENRAIEGTLIGTVAFKFAESLPIKSGETVVVGDTVIGAGSGEVKAGITAGYTIPSQVSAAAAATQSGSYVQADVQTIATLANALKTALNTLMTNLAVAQAPRRNVVVSVTGLVATVLML